ncbi:TetR/AcrR family transcriptional regulator [Planococcus sp. CPCC 101016]|uniref:TetR/AcrR family transcriptional regulator n=1 Tax=Planococcus sp. CPCC 101016 TaxID=2599617 RepID=UPI0011B84F5B|nr:TetR/AcrR family transcriptional regulator [Planococcus sp. CPCC 101016]TWT07999.1 TetR/AcrR family transcriptional regulator [Planococcus sp. CPCC 101016]
MSHKKEDLLIAAERLFYAHGFHAIGLKAIVQEAGVALMTLYNHFDSKEELILEILNRREETYYTFLEKVCTKETGSIERKLALGHLLWLKQNPSNGCMFLRAKEEFENEASSLIVQKAQSHKENLLHFFESQGLSRANSIQLSLLLEGSTSLAEIMNLDEIENALLSMVACIK